MADKKICSIDGCNNEAKRTISLAKAEFALKKEGLKATHKPKERKIHLCSDHYKKIKKHLKEREKLERARWG